MPQTAVRPIADDWRNCYFAVMTKSSREGFV